MREKPRPQAPLSRGPRYGYRAPSGRPVGPNPKVLHRSREGVAAGVPCHATIKVRKKIPSLRTPAVRRVIEETFRASEGKVPGFTLRQYVFQEDHMHLIVEADDADALRRGMGSLTARFGLGVNRALKRKGPVLEDRYHLDVLSSRSDAREAFAFMRSDARQRAALCRTLRCGRDAHA
jgi:putative transposase